MDAFGGEGDGEVGGGALTINASYAATFAASAQRAQEQRKAALVSSVPIPLEVLSAFTKSLGEALGRVPAPLCRCHPMQVAAHVIRLHRLTLTEDVRGEQRARLSVPADPGLAPALEAFLGVSGPGRPLVAKLLRWARGRAHLQKLKGSGAGAGGGGGGSGGEAALPVAPRLVAAGASSTPAVVVADMAQAPERPAPLGPTSGRRRGRGCGRDRGLGPTGEPVHADLHPSWKARRVIASRQRKAIHKDLQRLLE